MTLIWTVTRQSTGEKQSMLLQEASSEATPLQRQLGEHRAAGQQAGQRLRHTVTERVHTDIELLQALQKKTTTKSNV